MEDMIYKTFPHNPPHLYVAGAIYMITAATYNKTDYLRADDRKRQVIQSLLFATNREGWQIIACVAMSNHYHAVLRASQTSARRLSALINSVHRFTASQRNRDDGTAGRQVWWNYWDTCLTSEGAYFARINCVHWNPVKHQVLARPEMYEFSTYRLWQERWQPELQRIERDYPFDRVTVQDEF
jgi:putative transposase